MVSTMAHQRVITKAAAAAYIGVSRATFDRLRHDGKIATVQVGKRRVGFLVEELESYIQEHNSKAS